MDNLLRQSCEMMIGSGDPEKVREGKRLLNLSKALDRKKNREFRECRQSKEVEDLPFHLWEKWMGADSKWASHSVGIR